MKAKIKTIQPTVNGQNNIEIFDTILDLKKYLNEVLYYSNDVLLYVEQCGINEVYKYSETNDLRMLLSEAKKYDSVLCVLPEIW